MKSIKEICELAFKFSDNIIERIQASIDSGSLKGTELKDAEDMIAEYESHKSAVMSELSLDAKKFASTIDGNQLEFSKKNLTAFAMIRDYCFKHPDMDSTYEDQLLEMRSKLTEVGVSPDVVNAVISRFQGESSNYNKYLVEYNKMQVRLDDKDAKDLPELTNNIILAVGGDPTKVEFASEKSGKDYVDTGIKFLESMLTRMESAENPNQTEIENYKSTIEALKRTSDEVEAEVNINEV